MAMGLEQNISSFSTLESALQSVQDFQNETNSKFVMIKKRKAGEHFQICNFGMFIRPTIVPG